MPDDKVTRAGTTGSTASVTDEDKRPTRAGYFLDNAAGNVLEGKIAGDGSLVLKVYFKQITVIIPDPPEDDPTPDLNSDDHFAYIIGYPDGNVHPEAQITRAEVATVFFRLLKDDVRNENLTKSNTFSDVDESRWFNAKLDLAGLQDLIKKVMEMISSKTGELNGLQAQLKDLNPMDLLGEKGSNLKEQVQGLLSVVSTLKTKLGVYQDALKDKQ